MKLGMVSRTLNQFDPEKVIEIAKLSGMNAIEWSGDKHVIAGEFERAAEIQKLCENAGISIVAYGSDYRVGEEKTPEKAFAAVLKTAKALKTDNIRIRAGSLASEKVSDDGLERFIEETCRIADVAQMENVTLSFAYHANTLFDSYISAGQLLERINRKNVRVNWQPNQTTSMIYNIYELKKLLKYVKNVHVFYCTALSERCPLVEGKDGWLQYIKILKENQDRALLLKCVPDDSPESLARDFELLRRLAAQV